MDETLKRRMMQFASEKDTEYVIHITDDFRPVLYYVTGRNVTTMSDQPSMDELVRIVHGNGIFVLEPNLLAVYDTKLKNKHFCPRCEYQWEGRVASPKQCPRCQCRLDKHL